MLKTVWLRAAHQQVLWQSAVRILYKPVYTCVLQRTACAVTGVFPLSHAILTYFGSLNVVMGRSSDTIPFGNLL
jgi:hypothetical protein